MKTVQNWKKKSKGLFVIFLKIFNVILKDLVENLLVNMIWISMDIFGILDSDPQKNLCGSETLGKEVGARARQKTAPDPP